MAIGLSLGLVLVGGRLTSTPAQSGPLVLTNASVIDVTGGPTRRGLSILIVQGRIAAITPDGGIAVPSGARRFDAGGRFVIPGLWDMHAHTGSRAVYFPLYVANGILGIRDMGGDDPDSPSGSWSYPFDSLRAWREDVRAGRLLGPRIVAAGAALEGQGLLPGALGVAGPADARRKVDSLIASGVDFIKVLSRVPPESYLAVVQQATRRRIPVAGHAPDGLGAADAARAGQHSIEHLTGLPRECFAEGRCEDLLRTLAERRTWQVPTLVAWRNLLFRADSVVNRRSELRYLPHLMRRRWDSVTTAGAGTADDGAAARRTLVRLQAVVGLMHRAAVPILAGSDAANAYTIPGFSLHDELVLLVEAGLSPLAALQAATVAPAQYLGATDSLGTVAVGRVADLVVLDGDPLVDINHVRRVHAVVVNGRLIEPSLRHSLLANAEAAATGVRGRPADRRDRQSTSDVPEPNAVVGRTGSRPVNMEREGS